MLVRNSDDVNDLASLSWPTRLVGSHNRHNRSQMRVTLRIPLIVRNAGERSLGRSVDTLKTEAKTLGPEVGRGEGHAGSRIADEHAWRDLRRVDAQVDLIPGTRNFAPVQKRIAEGGRNTPPEVTA